MSDMCPQAHDKCVPYVSPYVHVSSYVPYVSPYVPYMSDMCPQAHDKLDNRRLLCPICVLMCPICVPYMSDMCPQAHDKLDNRRLLWHGTNVAVVAAVLLL